MKDINNLEIEYCHEGVIKTFMWHNKLKYWVCTKSPIKRDPIAYQRAPQKISRDLTHFALKENILDKRSLNIFGFTTKPKTKKILKTKVKNFIPLF